MLTCPSCGAANPVGNRFCEACAAALSVQCPACGATASPGSRFCGQCATPLGGSATGSNAGAQSAASAPMQRRMTSVLFGDLVGFTALSESRDPEDVRELLGRYFDTARAIVARYGGTIEKFIGDAVMAVWGVPTAHEDDAERATRAGLDLTEAVAAFGASVGAPGLAMRVGVVTGEVAATVGATNQGMVAGDAVNTAARVQAKALPGTVWVDTQTASLAGRSIDFTDAGVHELKGKAEPVALFAATAVRGGVGGERSSDRVQAPLVGRRRELSVLKEMFHVAAEEQRPRLVVVSGDAGIGKTRLGWELENYIDGLSANVMWHRGRCLAYGDGVAFSALTSAVRGRIGVGEDDSEAVVRTRLAESLETYVPDAHVRDRLLPALTNLLGLPGASELPRADLFSAWLTWFELLFGAEHESIVWVIDDAHHADEGLLDFIEHLSTVAAAPILIVLLTRPELLARRPSLTTLRRASMIGLETLSRHDVAALFDGLVEGLPADVRDALVERAEGNPLYAIETVRAMNDQGLTVPGPTRTPGAVRLGAGVDAGTLAALAAPASLQVLIASRLDLLPAPERAVLAAAAVLGQTFGLAALEAITEFPRQLPGLLQVLVGRDLLTTVTDRLSAEEGQYAFVQTVVRTVAYQTQSRGDRLARHLAVVAHFESHADGDSELNTVIAQHLRDALALSLPGQDGHDELARRLGQWLQRSAQRSIAVGAPSDAVRALDEALALAEDPGDLVRLRLLAAEAARSAGAMDECIAYAAPIVNGELAAGAADVGEAVVISGHAMRWTGRIEAAWDLLAPYMVDGALDGLPAITACRLARQIGAVLDARGFRDDRSRWSERALGLAESGGWPRELAAALNDFAIGQILHGHPLMGMIVLGGAAQYAAEQHVSDELARALSNRATFGSNRDLAASVADGYEAMAIIERIGDTSMAWHVALNLAVALVLSGRWDEIATMLDRPLLRERQAHVAARTVIVLEAAVVAAARGEDVDLAELDDIAAMGEQGQPESIDDVYYGVNRMLHARLRGDRAILAVAARNVLQLGLKYLDLDDDFPNFWTLTVNALIEVGDYAAARELFEPVVAAGPVRWTPLLAAELPRLRGTLNALDPAAPADADVEADLRAAITALDALGAVPDRARTQAALGAWLTRQNRPVDAAPLLLAARETFTELRAAAWLRELDSALALAEAG